MTLFYAASLADGLAEAAVKCRNTPILYGTRPMERLLEGLRLDTSGHYARPDIFYLCVDECAKGGRGF